MDFSSAPVRRHKDWRFLLRDLAGSQPKLRPLPSGLLRAMLSPVASLAWWLMKFAPNTLAEAVDRGSLQLLLPGAGTETMDAGRWFGLLPWMLGQPGLKTHVYLIGDELAGSEDGPEGTRGLSRAELERKWRTPAWQAVQHFAPGTIFNGFLSEWRRSGGDKVRVDACVLFSPGLSESFMTWLTEDDLLPYLRNGTPVGVFGYSEMDCLEDMEVLKMAGIVTERATPTLNPWRLDHEMSEFVGCGAMLAWRCVANAVPEQVKLDSKWFKDFDEMQGYVRSDYTSLGGDKAMERLGSRREVARRDGAGRDAILLLPHQHGILESTRELGEFDDGGFTPFEPSILVPPELMAERPDDSEVVQRMMWAFSTHRDWVANALRGRKQGREEGIGLFEGLDMADLKDGMRRLIKEATGIDYDPDDFMEQARAMGGVHGPTHPAWHDTLDALGWGPQEWNEDPGRYEHAFVVQGRRNETTLPVVCEAYAYFPDDANDKLAETAKRAVASRYPGGALLLFKSIPYTEVENHKYHFGGMLWWKRRWSPFAITMRMKSVDDVIDQVESGFEFGQQALQFADDGCGITIPFNCLCQGLDPNMRVKMMGLGSGKWVTLLPGG